MASNVVRPSPPAPLPEGEGGKVCEPQACLLTPQAFLPTASFESQVQNQWQIDLDITNLLRDGKWSALKYAVPGAAGRTADRAGNLRALLEARAYYQGLLTSRPGWEVSVGE